MKRAIAILLCLLVLVSFAFATGQDEPAGDPEVPEDFTLSFYRYSNAAHNAYTVPLIETYEALNPHVIIESVEVSSGGFEALAQKVLLGLAAGTPPDVSEMGYTTLKTMVESARVVPLDPFMEADAEFMGLNLSEAMLSLGSVDGTQYLMPLGVSTPVMFLNKDLFDEVGLDPSNPPTTWQETEDAAQVLADAGYGGVIWSWTTTGNWIFQNMIENNGGRVASEDASEINFNDPPGVEVMEYLYGLVSKGLMEVTNQVVQGFYTGELGMIVLSSFNRVRIPVNAEFEVVMAEMPTPDGSLPSLAAGGKGYMMLAEEDRQDESWNFIRFLGTDTAGRIVAENSGYTPPNLDLTAALQQENADDPGFVLTLGQATRVVPWYAWPGENGGKASAELSQIQEAILLGQVSPQEGLDQAAARARALLDD